MKECFVCEENSNYEQIGINKLFDSPLLYCEKCGLGYTSAESEILRAKLREIYQESYWNPTEDENPFIRMFSSDLYGNTLFNKLICQFRSLGIPSSKMIAHQKIIHTYSSGKRLLEIGSGRGYALKFFKGKNYKIRGIEPDRKFCNNINLYFNADVCRAGDAETMDIEECYDVIYIAGVFEHLVDPLQFIKKIRKNLSEKGVVLIEVPNCENEEINRISRMDGSHLYHFSRKSLSIIMKKANYRVLELDIYRNKSRNSFNLFMKQLFRMNDYEKSSAVIGDRIVLVAQKQ